MIIKLFIFLIIFGSIVLTIFILNNTNNKCIPNCSNKVCGSDGCGGVCLPNKCDIGSSCNSEGSCIKCIPNCSNKVCGSDGCGGVCLPNNCGENKICNIQGGCILDTSIPLINQKDIASTFWEYKWGSSPYGRPEDLTGVIQIVNGGSETMWIRYGGSKIKDSWPGFITIPSVLNNHTQHKWNELNTNGMKGQGDGFQLLAGEYQILPFEGSACWFGGTLGCCDNGNECVISPNGRGGGIDSSPDGQPNTLFEWTAPGVWDASLVDGFSLSMKVEVDGCGEPYNGHKEDCNNSDSVIILNLSKDLCPNKIINKDGLYIGCKSMCGCQNYAFNNNILVDPSCPYMKKIDDTFNNMPWPPGGYCGCPCPSPPYSKDDKCQDGTIQCSKYLRNVFKTDDAGINFCEAVTSMTKNSEGKRSVYCQAYDDDAGTKSYGNGVIKVTIYNNDFETIKDRTGKCSEPTPGQLPKCSDIGVTGDQCGDNKYICTNNKDSPSEWGCSNTQFSGCIGTQCIKN